MPAEERYFAFDEQSSDVDTFLPSKPAFMISALGY
jgi:hypothetical protein